MPECRVTVWRTPGHDARHRWRRTGTPCGQPAERMGLCAEHYADHRRLCRWVDCECQMKETKP